MVRRVAVFKMADPEAEIPQPGDLVVAWFMSGSGVVEDVRDEEMAGALRGSVLVPDDEGDLREATLEDGQVFLEAASNILPGRASRFIYEVEEG